LTDVRGIGGRRWYVDRVPIRIYRKTATTGATYPSYKPMTVYGSVWNGDQWATRGGLDKINYAYAPFVVTLNKFWIDACQYATGTSPPACYTNQYPYWWASYALSDAEKRAYSYYTKRYTVYNYCTDVPNRFPTPPAECADAPW
jgi:xyloglucan:xyloglucosyl transferase